MDIANIINLGTGALGMYLIYNLAGNHLERLTNRLDKFIELHYNQKK